MLIPSILQRAVDLYPDKIAVVSGTTRLTYAEFGKRVERLAAYLLSEGVKKGGCVAILHHNSHEFLEAYFAAARIGAVLTPLNIRLNPGELAAILKDAEATLLVTARRFRHMVEGLSALDTPIGRVLWTGAGEMPEVFRSRDYEEALREARPLPVPGPDLSPDTVAHLYYTSGTTGRPKGVMLTHRNVTTHALAAISELHITDRDTWAHVAPLFHLADAWATFAVTWVGGRHVTAPAFDPPRVLDLLQAERITLTNMIPTMLNMLVHTEGEHDFSSLRVVLSGGAPIAPRLVQKVMDTFRCDYIQTYGMTETSPYLTLSILKDSLRELPAEGRFRYKAMTGRPMIGVELRVVRPDGKDISADGREVGEIIVRGDTVSPGYRRRPEETAKAFRDGWLHTGDLAVMDPEGYVNIVDRMKDMIVTGGENVYSTEVENVLYAHPDILEAAVIGVPDDHWGEAVKACVVLRPGRETRAGDIINYCRERIASYKVPKSIDFFQQLPRTGSGKIFKKGLKELYSIRR